MGSRFAVQPQLGLVVFDVDPGGTPSRRVVGWSRQAGRLEVGGLLTPSGGPGRAVLFLLLPRRHSASCGQAADVRHSLSIKVSLSQASSFLFLYSTCQ